MVKGIRREVTPQPSALRATLPWRDANQNPSPLPGKVADEGGRVRGSKAERWELTMGQSGNNILSLLLQLGAHPQRAQSALKILDASSAGLEKDSKAMSEHTAEVLKATKAQQDAVAVFSRLHTQSQMAVEPLRQMHEAFRALAPEITTTTAQTDLHANAVERSTLALRSQTAVGAELVSKGLAGLVAGRKAQAGVEAVWETARGIALLAEGTWPPNPAAIMAAGLHFEAAAQYALLAGTGSHRRSAGGGSGAGSYGPRRGIRHG